MTPLPEIFASPAWPRLGWTLVHFLWQGAAVAAVLALTLRLLSHRRPEARYAAACAALALMAIAPVVTFCLLPPATDESAAAPVRTTAVSPKTAAILDERLLVAADAVFNDLHRSGPLVLDENDLAQLAAERRAVEDRLIASLVHDEDHTHYGAAILLADLHCTRALPAIRAALLRDRYFYTWEGPDYRTAEAYERDDQFTHHAMYIAAIERLSGKPLAEAVCLTAEERRAIQAEAARATVMEGPKGYVETGPWVAKWLLKKLTPDMAAAAPVVAEKPSAMSRLAARFNPFMPYVSTVWLAGVLCVSVWHLGGWLRVRRIRRSGLPLDLIDAGRTWTEAAGRLSSRLGLRRPVRLLRSARIAGPIVVGVVKPVILLPAAALSGLTPLQIEALLAHELAHIRRLDYLVNLLQMLVETVLFYHPAVWWVSARIRAERENCCDDLAVAACHNRRAYAEALVALAEVRQTAGAPALGATGGRLLGRIRRILGLPDPVRPSTTASAAATLLVVALLAISIAIGVSSGGTGATPAEKSADAKLAAKVNELVAQLGAKDGAQRDEAEKKLTALASAADIDALLVKSTASPDLEIKTRLARILEVPQWGEAVQGLCVAIQPGKRAWKTGETPKFVAGIRNNGTAGASILEYNWEVEIDGQWYVGADPFVKTRTFDVDPGREVESHDIDLGDHWATRNAELLDLGPGRHDVRVAASGWSHGDSLIAVRPVSRTMVIDILPADAKAAVAAGLSPELAKKRDDLAPLLALDREAAKDLTLDLGNKVTMKLVLIPAGKFMMGEEKDPHEVTLSKPFYMGVTLVTQAQYEAVIGSNPSHFKGATNPVDTVSWDDATEFCKKLSEKTGKTVRLPTEAEWEYACRAGTKTAFSFGDDDKALGDYAWHGANSGYTTHPVGQKKPNPWGLYDMHGNVWEWCADWYGDYPKGAATDPQGPASGTSRVLRGGGWDHMPTICRSAYRIDIAPDYRFNDIGYRVVVSVETDLKAPPPEKAPAATGTEADKAEPRLPGSDVTLNQAAKAAGLIVEATLDKAEVGDPSMPGGAHVTASLSSVQAVAGETQKKTLQVHYRVISIPAKEEFPKERSPYIFFLTGKDAGQMECIKVLPDTPANRKAVYVAVHGFGPPAKPDLAAARIDLVPEEKPRTEGATRVISETFAVSDLPNVKSLFDMVREQPVVVGGVPLDIVSRLSSLYGEGDEFLISEPVREGNRITVSIRYIRKNPQAKELKTAYLLARLDEKLPPDRYYVLVKLWECERKDGEIVVALKTAIREFEYLPCAFDVAGPGGKAPDIKWQLPGSDLSAEDAAKGDVMAAVCEAADTPDYFTAQGGVEFGKSQGFWENQKWKVLDVLAGPAKAGDVTALGVTWTDDGQRRETFFRKGERTIWLAARAKPESNTDWTALKALPDTPANRKAVVEAIKAGERTPPPAAGAPIAAVLQPIMGEGKPAAPAWGEAAEGVQVQLTAGSNKWTADQNPPLVADIRNTGKRTFTLFKDMVFWEVEVDGKWGGWSTLYSGGGSAPLVPHELAPGQEFKAVPLTLSAIWTLALDGKWVPLAPGKHTLRVAATGKSAAAGGGDVRVVSNAVQVEVLPRDPRSALAEPSKDLLLRLSRKNDVVANDRKVPGVILAAQNNGKETLYMGHSVRLAYVGPDGKPTGTGGVWLHEKWVVPIESGKSADLMSWAFPLEGAAPGRYRAWAEYVALPAGQEVIAKSDELAFDVPGPAGANKPEAAAGAWSAWSPDVNGMQFRIRAMQPVLDADDRLPVEIEVRNSGRKEVYMADPSKWSDSEALVWLQPFVIVDGQRRGLEMPGLAISLKPAQYTLLEPGKSLVGRRLLALRLPTGRQAVHFAVPWGDGGIPRGAAAAPGFGWPEDDLKRIRSSVWSGNDPDVYFGPIDVLQEHGEKYKLGQPQPLAAKAAPPAAAVPAVVKAGDPITAILQPLMGPGKPAAPTAPIKIGNVAGLAVTYQWTNWMLRDLPQSGALSAAMTQEAMKLPEAVRATKMDRHDWYVQFWAVPLADTPAAGADLVKSIKPNPKCDGLVYYLGQGQGYAWYMQTLLDQSGDIQAKLGLVGGEDFVALAIAEMQGAAPADHAYFIGESDAKAIPHLEKLIAAKSPLRKSLISAMHLSKDPAVGRWLVKQVDSNDKEVAAAARQALLSAPCKDAAALYAKWLDEENDFRTVARLTQFCYELKVPLKAATADRIMASPPDAHAYRQAFQMQRDAIGRPIPKEILEAEKTIREQFSNLYNIKFVMVAGGGWQPVPAGEPFDEKKVQAASQVFIKSADPEAAAAVAIDMAGQYLGPVKADVGTPQAVLVPLLKGIPDNLCRKLVAHLDRSMTNLDMKNTMFLIAKLCGWDLTAAAAPAPPAAPAVAPVAVPAGQDLRGKLAQKIDLDFKETAVSDVLKYASDAVHGLPYDLDPSLRGSGIDLAARRVSLQAKGITVEAALARVLAPSMTWRIAGDRLLIAAADDRKAAALTPELIKKRAALLAEADKQLKQGLRDLVKTFPQLASANNRSLDEALSRDAPPPGGLSVSVGRSNKEAKTTWRPEPIADAETWHLTASLRPKHASADMLLTAGYMASVSTDFGFNLDLNGWWETDAGDPKLKTALRKLLDDAFAPLEALDRDITARLPAGRTPATPQEMDRLHSVASMALGQDWQIDVRPGFWGSHQEPGVFFQGHRRSMTFKGPEGRDMAPSFTLYLHPLWAGKEPDQLHLPGSGLDHVVAESKSYRVYGQFVLPPDMPQKQVEDAILRILAAWPPYAGLPAEAPAAP